MLFKRILEQPPLRITNYLIGVLDIFFDEAKKIWTLQTLRVPTKNKPFRFHFSKDADKNLRVQIPVIFGRGAGGGGKKMERPDRSLCLNQTDTSAVTQHLKHESKAPPLKFFLLVQFSL